MAKKKKMEGEDVQTEAPQQSYQKAQWKDPAERKKARRNEKRRNNRKKKKSE